MQAQLNHLRQQNQRLLEQNLTLKQSLEDLIAVNSQLTESIQQFSNNNNLNDRIRELQNQNKSLKNQLHNSIRKMDNFQSKDKADALAKENEELSEIIKEIAEKSNIAQANFDHQLSELKKQLQFQKTHSENELRKMEHKHAQKTKQYEQTISHLKKRNENINVSIEQKVLKQSQQLQNEQRKSLKVSTTIQDLRNVLTHQIQQKDKIIHIYENLIEKLKEKIKQKY